MLTRMYDIQAEVGKWHVETFGPNCPTSAIERKLKEEVREFELWETVDEAADVCICLLAWCARKNVSLTDHVKSKLEVLRGRDQAYRDVERGTFTKEEMESWR